MTTEFYIVRNYTRLENIATLVSMVVPGENFGVNDDDLKALKELVNKMQKESIAKTGTCS